MSTKLLVTLMNPDVIPTEHTEWQNCLTTCGLDGYAALYNMISTVHPSLTKNRVDINIPTQKRNETFGVCINKFLEFFHREENRGRSHAHGHKIELIVRNLQKNYSGPFLLRLDGSYPAYQDWNNSNAPFDFQMHRLSTTFADWSETLGLNTKNLLMTVNEIDNHINDTSYVSTMPFADNESVSNKKPSTPLCVTITDRILTPEEENFTSSVTSLRSMRTPNHKRDLCTMTGHDKHSCDYLIHYALAAEHVRKDPSIKDLIFN